MVLYYYEVITLELVMITGYFMSGTVRSSCLSGKLISKRLHILIVRDTLLGLQLSHDHISTCSGRYTVVWLIQDKYLN